MGQRSSSDLLTIQVKPYVEVATSQLAMCSRTHTHTHTPTQHKAPMKMWWFPGPEGSTVANAQYIDIITALCRAVGWNREQSHMIHSNGFSCCSPTVCFPLYCLSSAPSSQPEAFSIQANTQHKHTHTHTNCLAAINVGIAISRN